MRVLVAMSGGVDSSVAAALMQDQGHEVIGVTLKLWEGPGGAAPVAGCCTVSDAEDARRVAAQLDIPYYVLDHTDVFMDGVVSRFIDDYANGRTPNPCIECNRTVKFTELMRRADELACDAVVTGHYARIRHERGAWRLFRGVDADKDQSYVLSMLGQEQLAAIRFPVGDLTKPQVRAVAESLGLRTAHKPESQDICFVGDDYREFLAEQAAFEPTAGPIVDTSGREVGRHDGVVNFTIGQRRGLGVAVGEARFVTDIDPVAHTVTIGRREDLRVDRMLVSPATWTGARPDGPVAGRVQYRAHGAAAEADIEELANGVQVTFRMSQIAIARGQTAAFYDGDEVIGGGIISEASGPAGA